MCVGTFRDSALARDPDHGDPRQAYSPGSVPVMAAWLGPCPHGHHTSQALPAGAAGSLQLISLRSPLASLDHLCPAGWFPTAHPSHTLCTPGCVPPFKQAGSQHPDFLCTLHPASHSPLSLEPFSTCAGTVGHL